MEDLLKDRGMLVRPRIHSLIEKGVHYPLLIISAGPGYGKTQTMSEYAATCDKKVLWLRLTELDNLTTHFWDHLVHFLEFNYTELSESLRQLRFPDTLSSFDAFVRLIEKHHLGKNTIWVFDDFGEITNRRIIAFFRMFADAASNDISIVLISNTIENSESLAFFSNRQYLILQKDLRFTSGEIFELYQMHGITLTPQEVSDIERQTQGWPLSLHLLVQQNEKVPDTLFDSEGTISYLFEARFFSAYPKSLKQVLLRLSLLKYFTRELAGDLFDGNEYEIDHLLRHSFISREPATGHLFLHYLYKSFLQDKQYLLSDKDKKATLQTAAHHYAANEDVLEAADSYRKCGDLISMVDAMCDYVKTQRCINDKSVPAFLEYLDLLTPEQRAEHPMADYLRAWIYMSIVELDKAESIAHVLERRFSQNGAHETPTMLGDVYILLGLIHAMRCQYDFGDYFEKALKHLPNGSVFLGTAGSSVLLNSNYFAMADNLPGAKEKMEAAVHYGMPKLAQVMCGSKSGTEHIWSAEAAYLSYQLDDAKEHSYRTIYSARKGGLHDLVCNGHYILAKIALLTGDFEEMSAQVENIVEYAGKHDIGVLAEIRDTALAWYYLELGECNRIPKSILNQNNFSKPTVTSGRIEILYAHYLLCMERYVEFVGMLGSPKTFYVTEGIYYDQICLSILLAIGYDKLGNTDAAVETLWSVYNMCHDNGIITPFIKAKHHLPPLLDAAQNQDNYVFDSRWCDDIRKKIAYCSAQTKAVRAAYRKRNPAIDRSDNPLSKRERELLTALSQGLTREEIALKHYISVNTVKSTIRSIYNKLAASNRAEAVSIAIAQSYIEGYQSSRG